MADLMEKLEYYIHFFGYAKDERENPNQDPSERHIGPNGVTYSKMDFYDYKGKAKQENKDAYMGFLEVNEKMLDQRIKEKVTEKYS